MQSNEYERESEIEDFKELLPERLNFCTSMNDDCMHHIFEYLEIADLLNVAETCRALNIVACQFFKRKYSGKKIVGIGCTRKIWDIRYLEKTLNYEGVNRNWKNAAINIEYEAPLMMLKLLRNFGSTISCLHMSSFRGKLMAKLGFYLAEYCCESLENLLVTLCDLRYLNFNKPLTNIESIFIYDSDFSSVSPFNSNIPNLKSLTLHEIKYETDTTKISFHFPSLTYFSFQKIEEFLNDQENVFEHQEREIIAFLKLNPQIEHLKVKGLVKHYTCALLKSIAESLPKLRNLALQNDGSYLFQNVEDIFHSASVEHFDLSTTLYLGVLHIPFTFPRLKSLIMTTGTTLSFVNFIDRHQELRSIYLRLQLDNLSPSLYHKFNNISLNIEELTIGTLHDFPEDIFFRFLKDRHRLKKFLLRGVFNGRSLSESRQSLCNAMTLNDIQFEVEPIENIESGTIKFHVKKFSNLLQKQHIIEISVLYHHPKQTTSIDWRTIDE